MSHLARRLWDGQERPGDGVLVVHSAAFVVQRGWTLLQSLADYEREHLLRAPSTRNQGARRCDPAHAIQIRLLDTVHTGKRTISCPEQLTCCGLHTRLARFSRALHQLTVPRVAKGMSLACWSAQASDIQRTVATLRESHTGGRPSQ